MIENLVKKKIGTFRYAVVTAVNEVQGTVQVQLGNNLQVWIQTSLDLSVGNTVIVARNDQDASRLIVLSSRKILPETGILLLV